MSVFKLKKLFFSTTLISTILLIGFNASSVELKSAKQIILQLEQVLPTNRQSPNLKPEEVQRYSKLLNTYKTFDSFNSNYLGFLYELIFQQCQSRIQLEATNSVAQPFISSGFDINNNSLTDQQYLQGYLGLTASYQSIITSSGFHQVTLSSEDLNQTISNLANHPKKTESFLTSVCLLQLFQPGVYLK